MNINTLDSNLRKHTTEEKRYLSGDFFDYSNFPTVGYYNAVPYISFDPVTYGKLITDDLRFLAGYKYLIVKKQDRFLSVPFHIHSWIEMNYMYSGKCTLTINDTTHVLETGQMSLIDTNAPHSISQCGENDILVNFIISKEYLDSNFFSHLSKNSFLSNFFIETLNTKKAHDKYILFHSEKSQRLPVFVNQFLCEYYDNSISSKNMLDSLMTLILCELINVFENDLSRERQESPDNAVIPIIRYIEENFNKCTLKSTAKFFNMHPNYLSSYLKRYTGSTYKELIQLQRMQMAADMLRETSLSIYDISYHVGYQNTSFFFQKFKESYGCTPKEYRKKNAVSDTPR